LNQKYAFHAQDLGKITNTEDWYSFCYNNACFPQQGYIVFSL